MKQIKIMEAYHATERLADNAFLPMKTLWDIYNLRKKLAPHKEFQDSRERAFIDKYSPFANQDGVVAGSKYVEYQRERDELDNLDIDVSDIQRIEIMVTENLGLTVRDIEALEPFVDFVQADVCKTAP